MGPVDVAAAPEVPPKVKTRFLLVDATLRANDETFKGMLSNTANVCMTIRIVKQQAAY